MEIGPQQQPVDTNTMIETEFGKRTCLKCGKPVYGENLSHSRPVDDIQRDYLAWVRARTQ